MDQILILGVMVIVSVVLIAYSLMPARKEDEEHILRRMSGKRVSKTPARDRNADPAAAAARSMLEKVAPIAIKPVMPKTEEEMTALRRKLAQAGFRQDSASRLFLASKTVLGVVLGALALMFSLGTGQETMALFGIASCSAGLGFFLPDGWLWLARSQRQEKIRNGLPDSLDLLVVSVESGLALDAGLQRVGDEMSNVHPELSEEMQIATLESQMGVPRSEALLNMATRVGIEEMSALIAIITQAEKFGTSVAKALRTQADTLRVKRRLKAEERAQKTTVKLMMPLIFFIFPSIFVVLLGPAAMKLIEALGNNPALNGG